ncbi:MAG: hypothetical protein ACWGO1_08245, partial [Anaerolineales bacterium]
RAVSQLVGQLEELFPSLPNARWVALRLLEGDEDIIEALRKGELGDLNVGGPEVRAQSLDARLEVA